MARSSTSSQPTATRPAGVRTASRSSRARSSTTVLATDRARPKTIPWPSGPAPEEGDAGAERRRHRDLPDCPRQGDTADGEQIPGGEVHANTEHQQDDADLGKLRGEVRCRRRSRA